jgi:hypothetical protein
MYPLKTIVTVLDISLLIAISFGKHLALAIMNVIISEPLLDAKLIKVVLASTTLFWEALGCLHTFPSQYHKLDMSPNSLAVPLIGTPQCNLGYKVNTNHCWLISFIIPLVH